MVVIVLVHPSFPFQGSNVSDAVKGKDPGLAAGHLKRPFLDVVNIEFTDAGALSIQSEPIEVKWSLAPETADQLVFPAVLFGSDLIGPERLELPIPGNRKAFPVRNDAEVIGLDLARIGDVEVIGVDQFDVAVRPAGDAVAVKAIKHGPLAVDGLLEIYHRECNRGVCCYQRIIGNLVEAIAVGNVALLGLRDRVFLFFLHWGRNIAA